MARTKLTPVQIFNPYKFRTTRNAAANTGNAAFAVVALAYFAQAIASAEFFLDYPSYTAFIFVVTLRDLYRIFDPQYGHRTRFPINSSETL